MVNWSSTKTWQRKVRVATKHWFQVRLDSAYKTTLNYKEHAMDLPVSKTKKRLKCILFQLKNVSELFEVMHRYSKNIHNEWAVSMVSCAAFRPVVQSTKSGNNLQQQQHDACLSCDFISLSVIIIIFFEILSSFKGSECWWLLSPVL